MSYQSPREMTAVREDSQCKFPRFYQDHKMQHFSRTPTVASSTYLSHIFFKFLYIFSNGGHDVAPAAALLTMVAHCVAKRICRCALGFFHTFWGDVNGIGGLSQCFQTHLSQNV